VIGEPLVDLAERALQACTGDAQATVVRERSLLSRFARSTPTQATAVDDTSVGFLVIRDGHTGSAETNDTSDDGLRDAALRATEAATSAARAAGGPGEHPGLPSTAEAGVPQGHQGLDAQTGRLDPAIAGEALRTAFAASAEHGLEAFGIWTAGHVETAIASSAGVRATDATTDAYLKVIARDADGRSGWGAAAGVAADDLDVERVAAAAIARVAREAPIALAPGEYPVVLEPDAVGALLDMLAGLAFDGRAHAEGRGALSGRMDSLVAAEAVTLFDDPLSSRTLPRAFDADGVAKAPLALIEAGVARNVVHDRRSAALAGDGATSTGHALVPGGSPHGTQPTNLVLAGGTATDVAELIRPIERGLYVTRLWYLNVVHERSTLLTGTTRDGTFLIEDGRITRPVLDVRFTDSALGLLERTEALTAATSLVCEADFYGRRFAYGAVVPALRARAFRVTGQTTGA
jgi:predicted Zn-dependent protease